MSRDGEMVKLYQKIEQHEKKIGTLEHDKRFLLKEIEVERKRKDKQLDRAIELMTKLIGQTFHIRHNVQYAPRNNDKRCAINKNPNNNKGCFGRKKIKQL
jgi:hypothetical protein